ncbi:uncharacterized protein LOC100186034 [Ciona intestinalis]
MYHNVNLLIGLAIVLYILPTQSTVINFDSRGGSNPAIPPPVDTPVLIINGTLSPIDQQIILLIYNSTLNNTEDSSSGNGTDPRLFPIAVQQPLYFQQLSDILNNKTLFLALMPPSAIPPGYLQNNNRVDDQSTEVTTTQAINPNRNQVIVDPPYEPTSGSDDVTSTSDPKTITTPYILNPNSQCGVFPACSIGLRINEKSELTAVTCHKPVVDLLVAITIILSIVIVLSNVLIIVVTMRTRSLRKPHGYFKVSLAVSDLLMGLLVLPSVAHNILNGIKYQKSDYKQLMLYSEHTTVEGAIFGIVGIISSTTTVFGLFLLTIDSYLSVRWPVKYRVGDIMTTPRALFLIAFIWIIGLAVSALPILAKDYLEYRLVYFTFMYMPYLKPIPGTEGQASIHRYLHGVLYAVFVWGLPFLITWILTIMTSCESMRMLRHMRDARRQSVRSTKALNRVDRDIRRTVAVVLLLFTITVLPVFVVIVTFLPSGSEKCPSKAKSVAYYVTTVLLVAGSFFNVIIYNVCNKEFREACFKLFVDMLRPCCFESVTAMFEHQDRASKRRADYWKSNASKKSSKIRDANNDGKRSLSASTAVTSEGRSKSVTDEYSGKAMDTTSTSYENEQRINNNSK